MELSLGTVVELSIWSSCLTSCSPRNTARIVPLMNSSPPPLSKSVVLTKSSFSPGPVL